jgi:GntR family transcriptional regulator/MocR family aminotransferase
LEEFFHRSLDVIFDLNRQSHTPLYLQITSQVRRMIASGTLKIGDRLPPNRELARTLGVNRTTVTTAYAELAADGLINSHVGRGTFVSGVPRPSRGDENQRAQPSPIPWNALLAYERRDPWLTGMLRKTLSESVRLSPGKQNVSLAFALPPADMFPLDDFRRCVDRVLRREGRTLLQLGASRGYEPLLDYLANQMALSGVQVKPEEVLITNGCQQSLDLIRRVLVGPNDEVAIEDPTYPGALSVFCGDDSRFISVPVDDGGLNLDVLEDILAQRRPKLIYTIPSFHNPTGVSMDMAARRRLIEMALQYRAPIIEDDIYRELRYDGPSAPPLKAIDEYGLVIYVNSFSKVGFPGLRVGWIAAPAIVIEHLNREKQKADLHAGMLSQAALYEFSRHGLLARHIKRVKRAYTQRRDAMVEALDRYFPPEARWHKPDGGMAVWVTLPPAVNTSQLLLQAVESGITFSPSDHFYSSLPQQNMMRLSFTLAAPSQIEDAVKRLSVMIKARLATVGRRRFEVGDAARALV